MSKKNKHFKINLHPNGKFQQDVDYLIAGPDMETNRVASADMTQKIHKAYTYIFI